MGTFHKMGFGVMCAVQRTLRVHETTIILFSVFGQYLVPSNENVTLRQW